MILLSKAELREISLKAHIIAEYDIKIASAN